MSPKQCKFETIMEFAHEVERHNPNGLIELVRLCGLSILGKFLSWRISERAEKTPQMTRPDFLFLPRGAKIDADGRTFDKLCPDTGERPQILLGKHTVLPWPWNRLRLARSLASIGEGRKWAKWKHDAKNHYIELWQPLGIAWGLNGNHSMTAGIIRCEGKLRPKVVRNIAPIYEHIHCDGAWFFRQCDGARLAPVRSPEFAAVFEIGRIMVRHGVSA